MIGGCLAGLGLILASQATRLVHLYLTMGVISGNMSQGLTTNYSSRSYLFTLLTISYLSVSSPPFSSRFGLGACLHPHGSYSHGKFHPAAHPGIGPGVLQHWPLLLCFQPTLPAAGGKVRLARGPSDSGWPQSEHCALRGSHPTTATL